MSTVFTDILISKKLLHFVKIKTRLLTLLLFAGLFFVLTFNIVHDNQIRHVCTSPAPCVGSRARVSEIKHARELLYSVVRG